MGGRLCEYPGEGRLQRLGMMLLLLFNLEKTGEGAAWWSRDSWFWLTLRESLGATVPGLAAPKPRRLWLGPKQGRVGSPFTRMASHASQLL